MILELATTIHELDDEKEIIRNDKRKLAILFKEMIQMCLWGNATVSLIIAPGVSSDELSTGPLSSDAFVRV